MLNIWAYVFAVATWLYKQRAPPPPAAAATQDTGERPKNVGTDWPFDYSLFLYVCKHRLDGNTKGKYTLPVLQQPSLACVSSPSSSHYRLPRATSRVHAIDHNSVQAHARTTGDGGGDGDRSGVKGVGFNDVVTESTKTCFRFLILVGLRERATRLQRDDEDAREI